MSREQAERAGKALALADSIPAFSRAQLLLEGLGPDDLRLAGEHMMKIMIDTGQVAEVRRVPA